MKPDSDIATLIKQASSLLEDHSDSPLLDAQLLLCEILGKDRSYLIAWPETQLDATAFNTFVDYLEKRKHGIPIAYILGYKEFWSMNFSVTEDVLIPRPETELLVELVLTLAESITQPHILDLGTGSGAIALALAKELPHADIIATDRSTTALEVAQINAENLGLNSVQFIESDWFNALEKASYNIIVSNPPYIEQRDPHLEGEIKHEPLQALASGEDGLDDIRVIISGSKEYLTQNGQLLLEHGYDQGKRVRSLMKDESFSNVDTLRDHAGNDRVTVGKLPQ